MKRITDVARVVVLSAFASCGAAAPESVPPRDLVRPYHDAEPAPALTFRQKVARSCEQYDVEPSFALAIGDKESGLKQPKKPTPEPSLIDDAVKVLPDTASVKEVRALASSYCPFQITGLTARSRNVHYTEINDDLCAELACAEIARWSEIHKGDKLKIAASYNGGSKPPAVSFAYARDVLKREVKFKRAG